MSEHAKFTFRVEWYDKVADLVKTYSLYYYTEDSSVEMFDIKNRRTFLKRCSFPLSLKDLFIGSTVTVFSRQLKIVGFGDAFTERELGSKLTSTTVVIKPEGYESIGRAIDVIIQNDLSLKRLQLLKLNSDDTSRLCEGKVPHAEALEFTSGPSVAIEVIGNNAVQTLNSLVSEEEKGNPHGFQRNGVSRSSIYTSPSETTAEVDSSILFGGKRNTTATQKDCTICVILPHALSQAGKVIDAILEDGYEISAAQSFQLDRTSAAEFLEVYNTVVPHYNAMVDQLCSGTCIALEIRSDSDVVSSFRELVGPSDPEIARVIRPKTLRARFGSDKIANAVHCTDLSADGPLESEFFFSILQQ